MTTLLAPLDFYARHGCALFPLPAGSKIPGPASFWSVDGAAGSFKRHHSSDPTQWARWSAELQCNFGLVAFASRLLVVDVDTSELGRDAAWALWVSLCAEWSIPVAMPHTQSARGGWHILFQVPDHVAPESLRQPDAIKKYVNIRCIGYVVAAGSYYDGTAKGEQSGPYQLLTDAAPYPAPAALIEHCTRRPAPPRSATVQPGSLDPAATATLLTWLNEREQFADYESWFQIGMAIKLEFGDAGFPLWELTFDPSVTPETAASKWDSFATEPDAHSVTLLSFLARAHKLGWKGSIGRSTQAMFGDVVANIAASAGASLSAPGGSLIGNTQKHVADLGQPILETFFETTRDVPLNASVPAPRLPDAIVDHALFDSMNQAITRIMAMAEVKKSFAQQRVWRVLSVLSIMHPATYQAVVDRINGIGCALTPSKLESHNKQFEISVTRATHGDMRTSFHTDSKNKPDSAISDNVGIFLSLSNHKVRFDSFPKRAEVAHNDGDYRRFDQDELDRLWMLAKSADYNYHPANDVFRRGVKVEAKKDEYDSLEGKVYELARKWDGQARLDAWLSRTCGVADDVLHRAIGRNLLGGMVRRARYPGCVQAETVIFISPKQGTGKSSLCRILALKDDWFLGSFKFGQSQQSSLPLLAGKWVVELGELAGLNKTDFEDVKTFLSETKDEYVAKYESEPTENMRRCVFIGTSNVRQPLGDPSGNRRFLPVHVPGEIDLEWLRDNIEQLIGEAARRDEMGESFAIPREIWALTETVQEAARNVSPVEEMCYSWFDRPGAFYILSSDLMNAFRMSGLGANVRISAFMDKMGWRKAQVGTHRDRVWIKHTNNNVEDCLQLVPAQQTANGRVEMRIRQGAAACPVPLPPPIPLPRVQP